jgi:glucosamine 6-phosphate synthetase-like amidotransferase/phosphosugar isomerase protein
MDSSMISYYNSGMCGIYCSDDSNTFEVLGEVNQTRGNFATGVLYVTTERDRSQHSIIRREGSISIEDMGIPESCKLFLGHNQAPTSSKRDFQADTSHPFEVGDWVVAHNGVLTNFKKLQQECKVAPKNPVDSYIIPYLLSENDYNNGPSENIVDGEINNITKVLQRLEGTYAIWMYNTWSNNLYIARQGSTLFYKGTHVSSIKGNGYTEVAEGTIYKYEPTGYDIVSTFNHKSPFLTL